MSGEYRPPRRVRVVLDALASAAGETRRRPWERLITPTGEQVGAPHGTRARRARTAARDVSPLSLPLVCHSDRDDRDGK